MSHSLAHQSVLSFIFLPRLSCGFLTPLCLSVFPSFYSATRQTPAVTLSAAGAFSIPVSPLFSLLTFTLSTLVLSLSLLSFLSPFLPLVNDSVGYTGFCFLSLLPGVMNVGAYIPSLQVTPFSIFSPPSLFIFRVTGFPFYSLFLLLSLHSEWQVVKWVLDKRKCETRLKY